MSSTSAAQHVAIVAKRVSFPEEDVVANVFVYESQNRELSKELFYQSEDYIQFRQSFRAHKQRKNGNRVSRMSQEARNELLMKQQIAKMSQSTDAPLFRLPRSSIASRGCALMA